MDKSGVARDLYDAISVWAGGLPGGVAAMTLFAAVFMAATTGIIGGEIILLGLVALPQMLRLGYDQRLAIGTICAGGSFGTMIPPSIVLIFFGLTASVSIGELFIAVILPSLLLASFYLVYVLVRCSLNPALGPPASIEQRDIPLRAKLALLKGLILPLMVAFGVLGSIYAGIAAVAEAAALGVAGTIFAAWNTRPALVAAPPRVGPTDHEHLWPAPLDHLWRHRPHLASTTFWAESSSCRVS